MMLGCMLGQPELSLSMRIKCLAQRTHNYLVSKIVSEYDQEIPQSQTADKPVALRERATQQSLDTRKTN